MFGSNNVDKYRDKYSDSELMSWTIPNEEVFNKSGIFNLHYNYFDRWNPYTNFELAKENVDLKSDDRNAGTCKFCSNRFIYVRFTLLSNVPKFGFGRCC